MAMQSDYMVTEEASVGYQKRTLIDHVNLHVKKGEILTLIGPNGVGKSTILKSIIRQLSLIAGTVSIDGKELSSYAPKELAKKMAIVMTERIHQERYTCYDVVATGRYPYTGKMGMLQKEDEEKIEEAMRQVQVEALRDQDFERISDGQRQRVMLARAICQEPEILVLDEPTSYLDIRYKTDFLWLLRSLARKRQMAVVMSLHEIDLAQKLSDRLRAEKCFVLLHLTFLPVGHAVEILRERRQTLLKRFERVGREARGHLRGELLLQRLAARDDRRCLVRAHEPAAAAVAGVARAQQVTPAHEIVHVERHDARLELPVRADVARGV